MARITKAVARRMLGDVPDDKRFWCSDGRELKNLLELETALKEMSEETFRYHSNENKNDFSKWVGDVIGDEELSRDLQKSATRVEADKSVASRVAWLRSRR